MEVTGKHLVVGLVAFGGLLGAIAYWGQPIVRLRPGSAKPRPTLAVLPFDNLLGDPELERLAADVTLAVTQALQELPEYDLVPRERVLEHKGLAGGVDAIASELGADYVLAGSVGREDGRIRLEAYFVKPGDRPRIWADELYFDPEQEEQVPEAVARHVRKALAP